METLKITILSVNFLIVCVYMGVYKLKLVKLYTLNICILLCVNITSIRPFTNCSQTDIFVIRFVTSAFSLEGICFKENGLPKLWV